MTAYYEQQPGESARAAAQRTGAAPDVADTIPRAYLRQAVQRLGAAPGPAGWLADADPAAEGEQMAAEYPGFLTAQELDFGEAGDGRDLSPYGRGLTTDPHMTWDEADRAGLRCWTAIGPVLKGQRGFEEAQADLEDEAGRPNPLPFDLALTDDRTMTWPQYHAGTDVEREAGQ